MQRKMWPKDFYFKCWTTW